MSTIIKSRWGYENRIYSRDVDPNTHWFYSEYRVSGESGNWKWQLVNVTWDDEDQVTERVVKESSSTFLTAPLAMVNADEDQINEHR